MKTEIYTIELTRPRGVSKCQLKDYIQTAVASWAGGGDPDDPIWNLKDNPITVKSQNIDKCKGCGHPENKPLPATALACCPESTIKNSFYR